MRRRAQRGAPHPAGADDRLLVVVGPCSIHDPTAALEYARAARRLAPSATRDDARIVMRVYFEKPRTTVGWKGLINDPHLDGSFEINEGLRIARAAAARPRPSWACRPAPSSSTRSRRSTSPTWSAGARSARAPPRARSHRELASGLSMPVGFKNGTDGNVQIAIDAIRPRARPAPLPVGHQAGPVGDRRDHAATPTATSSCAAASRPELRRRAASQAAVPRAARPPGCAAR